MFRTPLKNPRVLEEADDRLSDKLSELNLTEIESLPLNDLMSVSKDLKNTYQEYKVNLSELVSYKRKIGATEEVKQLLSSLKSQMNSLGLAISILLSGWPGGGQM